MGRAGVSVFTAVRYPVRHRGTDPCALGIPIGEVVRGHVHLHLWCQLTEFGMKVKPQCDLLELWPSVLWTSFNGITLKLVRNTASGDQPIPAASDTLLGGGGVTICISTSMQVGEALHK